MEILHKIPKSVKIVGGALAIGAIIYLLQGKEKDTRKTPENSRERKLSAKILFKKDAEYQNFINILKPRIATEISLNSLAKLTMNTLNKLVILVIKEHYLLNLSHDRKERRRYLNDPVIYMQVSIRGQEEVEKLIELGTLEVLKDLVIEPTFFEEEVKRHLRMDPNMGYLVILMLESLKVELVDKNKGEIPRSTFTGFIKYQIENYEKVKFENVLELPFERFLVMKQTYVGDLAAVKFNLEEDDFLGRPELVSDPEMKELYEKLQQKFAADESNMFEVFE